MRCSKALTMGEFFTPWRRRIGVATLLTACVSMIAWIRSYVIGEILSVPCGQNTSFELMSKYNQLLLSFVERHDPVVPPFYARMIDNPHEARPWWDIVALGMGTSGVGFPIGTFTETRLFVGAPHFAIVIPLILLSVYLLLSKSRLQTDTSDTQPGS